ncbi:MAG: hypothetical protein JSV70_03665, partial [bacterium]
MAADTWCGIIYPPDKTSVDLATITVFGMMCDPEEVPRIILNRQGVIPQMFPTGTFRQSMVLNRGLNMLKVERGRYFISFDPPGEAPAKGYVRRVIHEPVQEDCTHCHDFSVPGKVQWVAPVPELCLNCHDDPAKGLSHSHGALEEGCTVCHDPHVWEEGRTYKKDIPDLCYGCHDHVAKGRHVHEPAAEGDCLACHGAHGSNSEALLVVAGDALCLLCHDDPSAYMKTVHPAMEEGCLTCHE